MAENQTSDLDYSRHPLKSFADSLDELDAFLDTHVAMLHYVSIIGPSIAGLLEQRQFKPEGVKELRGLGEKAKLAQRDRQYLFELVLIRLWTILELVVDETAILRLRTNGWWKSAAVTRKVKGSLVDFVKLNEDQQLRYILDEVSLTLGGRRRRGIDGFEELMEKLELPGVLDPEVRRWLIRLGATRNIIVHNHGVVDFRFTEQCPWVAATHGRRLPLDATDMRLFRLAATYYIYELGRRMQDAGLFDPGEVNQTLFTEGLAGFKRIFNMPVRSEEAEENGVDETTAPE